LVTGSPSSVAFTGWISDPGDVPAVVGSFISSASSSTEASFAYGDASLFTAGQTSFDVNLLPDFAVYQGNDFVAGYMSVHNGTIADGTGVSQVTLQMDFSGLILDSPWTQTLDAQLNIFNTPNVNVDPFADADAYYFTGFEDSAFHVLEGQTSTIEILLNYDDLSLAGFGSVVGGGGFIGPLPSSGPVGVPDDIGWTPLPVLAAILLIGTGFRRREA